MKTIELGKQIQQAIQDGDATKAVQLLHELQGQIFDLKEENARLQQQIYELETRHDKVEEYSFDGTYYWRGEDDQRKGPFCQRCMDGERRAIRLHHMDKTVSGYKSEWYECHNCQTKIEL